MLLVYIFLMKFDFGWESIIYAMYPRIEVFLDQSVGEKFYFIFLVVRMRFSY